MQAQRTQFFLCWSLSLFLSCAFSLHLLFPYYFFLIICRSHLFSLSCSENVHLSLPNTCTKNTHNCIHTVPGSVSCVTCIPLCVLQSVPTSLCTVKINSPLRNVVQTSVCIFFFSVWPGIRSDIWDETTDFSDLLCKETTLSATSTSLEQVYKLYLLWKFFLYFFPQMEMNSNKWIWTATLQRCVVILFFSETFTTFFLILPFLKSFLCFFFFLLLLWLCLEQFTHCELFSFPRPTTLPHLQLGWCHKMLWFRWFWQLF